VRIAVSAARLVQPESGKVLEHPLVLIEGERILEVRQAAMLRRVASASISAMQPCCRD
jgi:hypothetical protein